VGASSDPGSNSSRKVGASSGPGSSGCGASDPSPNGSQGTQEITVEGSRLEPGWQTGRAEMVRRARFFGDPASIRPQTTGSNQPTNIIRWDGSMSPAVKSDAARNRASQESQLVPKEGRARRLEEELHTFLEERRREEEEQLQRALSDSAGDQAVIDVALYNYEMFHNLLPGTATFTMVHGTSAGIEGWATAVISEETPNAGQEAANASVNSMSERRKPGRKSRGDEEEALQLQIALLESVGAKPNRLKDMPSEDDDDDDDGDYLYGYDSNDNLECENSSCCSEEDLSCEGKTDNAVSTTVGGGENQNGGRKSRGDEEEARQFHVSHLKSAEAKPYQLNDSPSESGGVFIIVCVVIIIIIIIIIPVRFRW
jgi:hypothetical protein